MFGRHEIAGLQRYAAD